MTEAGAHLSFGELADYWTSDLSPDEAQRLEAHVFACDHCARLLAQTEGLRTGIRVLAHAGGFQAFVTESLLNQLAHDGVRVRSYTLEPGDRVPCTAWADDEVIVARLRGDFTGITSVDAEMRFETGEQWTRVVDVPVREGALELVLALPADVVRGAPEVPMHLTLRAAEGPGGAGVIAEYVFDHRGAHDRSVS
ncbi:MAG TPA: zf-HC2 domain-containing protein, partial [Vicinamibacterales bacterium]